MQSLHYALYFKKKINFVYRDEASKAQFRRRASAVPN